MTIWLKRVFLIFWIAVGVFMFDVNAFPYVVPAGGLKVACDELRLTDGYAAPPFGVAPAYLIRDFLLMVGIENPGPCTHTGVYVEFSILDPGQNVVLTQILDIGTVGPGEVLEELFFEECVQLPSEAEDGSYTGTYRLYSDFAGLDPALTTRSFEFLVDGIIGLDLPGALLEPFIPPSTDLLHRVRALYYIPDPEGMKVCCVQVGVVNAPEMAPIGGSLLVYLHVWEDLNLDGLPQEYEMMRLGFNQYEFEAGDPPNSIFNIELYDEQSPSFDVCVTLDSGEHQLILTVEYIPPFTEPDKYVLLLAQPDGLKNFGYALEAYEKLKNQGLTTPCEITNFTGLLFFINDQLIFPILDGPIPVMRLCLEKEFTSAHPSPSSESALILAPNPAGQFLEVSFSRETPVAQIDFFITDVQGRALVPSIFRVGEDRWTLDVSGLAAGMYFISVHTDNSVATSRFVVQR